MRKCPAGWWRVEYEDRRLPEGQRWRLIIARYTFRGAWGTVNDLIRTNA